MNAMKLHDSFCLYLQQNNHKRAMKLAFEIDHFSNLWFFLEYNCDLLTTKHIVLILSLLQSKDTTPIFCFLASSVVLDVLAHLLADIHE